MQREEIVQAYFRCWLNQDSRPLGQIFAETVYYSECYGPEYHGLPQLQKWFTDWNQRGRVLQWEIKRFLHQGPVTVAEWYFQCEFDGKTDGFDGVSMIEFDENGKIKSVQEFQSQAKHYTPYK